MPGRHLSGRKRERGRSAICPPLYPLPRKWKPFTGQEMHRLPETVKNAATRRLRSAGKPANVRQNGDTPGPHEPGTGKCSRHTGRRFSKAPPLSPATGQPQPIREHPLAPSPAGTVTGFANRLPKKPAPLTEGNRPAPAPASEKARWPHRETGSCPLAQRQGIALFRPAGKRGHPGWPA
ncbi:hypothetical protein OFAG_02217 [Oxalobacter formigenes HOxBLS]|uniref:Uncharacterized protein n=1 Tax=Oxalobacter paraformigenes TaxID=556268 RepID=T5LEC5_9BURK|nr:hypothetical protein OFAG_02217 [Oxalobacter paraformigenes]